MVISVKDILGINNTSDDYSDESFIVFVSDTMNWKKKLRAFFNPIKINILSHSVSETEFDEFVATLGEAPKLSLFSLDSDFPEFLGGKYKKEQKTLLDSTYFRSDEFNIYNSVLRFKTKNNSTVSEDLDLAKVTDVILPYSSKSPSYLFGSKKLILIEAADSVVDVVRVSSFLSGIENLENFEIILASDTAVDPEVFGKEYCRVSSAEAGKFILNVEHFIGFSDNHLLNFLFELSKATDAKKIKKEIANTLFADAEFNPCSFIEWLEVILAGYYVGDEVSIERVSFSAFQKVVYIFAGKNTFLNSFYSGYDILYGSTKLDTLNAELKKIQDYPKVEVVVDKNLAKNFIEVVNLFCSNNDIPYSYFEQQKLNRKHEDSPISFSMTDGQDDSLATDAFDRAFKAYSFKAVPDFEPVSNELLEQRLMLDRLVAGDLNQKDLQGAYPQGYVLIVDNQATVPASSKFTINDVIKIAEIENPDAAVLYFNPAVSRRDRALELAKVFPHLVFLKPQENIFPYLDKCSKLYTIDSIIGFDALIRGVPVVNFANTFYSGYGLTDDRSGLDKKRPASLQELFYFQTNVFTKYFDVLYKKEISYAESLNILEKLDRIYKSKQQFLEMKSSEDAYAAGIQATQAVAAKKKIARKPAAGDSEFPEWYNPYLSAPMQKSLESDKPVFLYIPWIAEHGNTLIARIRSSEYELIPLDFIENLNLTRKDVFRFARSNPDQYRRMIARRLVPLRNRISGVILTFDWAPVMRIIFGVCEELNIPRVLIPHESVFVDRNKYYWDPFAQASRPVADVILGWGGLQRDIFLERGYPSSRFIAVGAPKFDPYADYQPQLSRAQFCRLFGLHADRKIILFASQPLDSQLDHKVARESQRQAVLDLLDYCEENGHQLLMRLPPSKDDILGKPLRDRLTQSEHGAVDDAVCYLVGAEEALYHCDLVTSVNSTMLFEGVLVGRPALSMKYIEFEQIWEGVGIPAAHNREETYALVTDIFSNGWKPTEAQMQWGAEMFSNGAFDGKASERIRQYLENLATNPESLKLRASALTRLLDVNPEDATIDLLGADLTHPEVKKIKDVLPMFFNAAGVVDASLAATDISKVSSIDVFLQWANDQDLNQREVQQALGKERLILQDGLLVTDKAHTPFRQKLSISFDDAAVWSERTTQPSRLEALLQSDAVLKRGESTRVTKVIQKLVENRLSRYNHLPDIALKIGSNDRPKLLLIDSIGAKDGSDKALELQKRFREMVREVISKYPDHDILIKTELPKTRYVAANMIAHLPQVYFIDFNIHLNSLFDVAEKVFVVNAVEGFEALLRDKEVHCYGQPFYAGWGVTTDYQPVVTRTNKRTVKEIFHFAYIVSSRYYLPTEQRVCEIEELIDYIVAAEL